MIRACIETLARISRQEKITTDDVSAMGAPSECLTTALSSLTRQAVEALHADGVRTKTQLRAALNEATNEELKALLEQVKAEMPNPFEWSPPTEPFCSFCDKRPSWWRGSTWAERSEKGYKRTLVDYENQEVELHYRGQVVWCEECEAACGEMDEWEVIDNYPDHYPDPYADDPVYERWYLEMDITRCLNADWGSE